MNASIIGCGTLRSGQVACVATTRKQNSVHVCEGREWKLAARWAGKEVTAACACGDTMVCAALDDVAYLVRGSDVTEIKLPVQSDWIYGAAALSDDVALLGGQGLFLLSVKEQSVTRRRLSEFNISRPGRDILRVVRTGGRTIVLGKKNLLVEYVGESAVELIDRRAIGAELFFSGAAQLGQDLWLCGMNAHRPFLARLDGATLNFEDLPLIGQSLPSLATRDDALLIGGAQLWAGRPGQWRDLLPSLGKGSIVAFASATSPHPLCAVSSDGAAYFTDGHACVEISIF